MASRMPTRCYVHIELPKLNYHIGSETSFLCPSVTPRPRHPSRCSFRAKASLSRSLLFSSLPLSFSALLLCLFLHLLSSPLSASFLSHSPRSFLLSPSRSRVRSTLSLSLFLFLFPFCSCPSLPPIVDRLPA